MYNWYIHTVCMEILAITVIITVHAFVTRYTNTCPSVVWLHACMLNLAPTTPRKPGVLQTTVHIKIFPSSRGLGYEAMLYRCSLIPYAVGGIWNVQLFAGPQVMLLYLPHACATGTRPFLLPFKGPGDEANGSYTSSKGSLRISPNSHLLL